MSPYDAIHTAINKLQEAQSKFEDLSERLENPDYPKSFSMVIKDAREGLNTLIDRRSDNKISKSR